MKFILVFNGAIGCKLGPNSISAPEFLAHQCRELIPFPMNRAAKRLGNGPGAPPTAGAVPHTGMDSSQGRAIATPTPRRNALREVRRTTAAMDCEARIFFYLVGTSARPRA